MDIQQNRAIQVNWGTINIPTILSVLGLIWYTATHVERQDSRLDTIESSRADSRTDINQRFQAVDQRIAPIENLVYRMNTLETVVQKNNEAVNARIDRQTDALQDIRTSIGNLSTSFEVLSQKIENNLPLKKTELAGPSVPVIPSRN